MSRRCVQLGLGRALVRELTIYSYFEVEWWRFSGNESVVLGAIPADK
jgi:hypothetical protein